MPIRLQVVYCVLPEDDSNVKLICNCMKTCHSSCTGSARTDKAFVTLVCTRLVLLNLSSPEGRTGHDNKVSRASTWRFCQNHGIKNEIVVSS